MSESLGDANIESCEGNISRSFWANAMYKLVRDEDELVVEIEELSGGLSRSRGVFGTIIRLGDGIGVSLKVGDE